MEEHLKVVLWAGFVLGLFFGAVGQRLEFCFSGGLREWWQEKNPRRAAALLVALATALLGSQIVAAAGWVDFHQSLYWPLAGSWLLIPLGGLLFGYGMMVARGCGSRALVLLGDGNMRSLVVLFGLALGAGLTLTGVLANLRNSLAEKTALEVDRPGLTFWLESWGLPASAAWIIPTILLTAAALFVGLIVWGLRKHPSEAILAAFIGLLIPVGWWITGRLGADDFDPVTVESLTFVAPVANSVNYLMLSTGLGPDLPRIGFGIVVVGGVLLGSLVTSLATRQFAWRGFQTPRQVLESFAGGLAMGIGGALAMGCTVGHGLTGWSTLSLFSLVAFAAILAGSALALRGPLAWRN